MEVTDTIELEVAERSQISEARRRILKMSVDYGLDQNAQDRVSLVVTELGTNLIKHSPLGGKFLVQGLLNSEAQGLEIFSLDNGPGMDVRSCLQDGFSTTETLGNGLGAAKRNSDEFDIYSQEGIGSAVKVRFWNKGVKPKQYGGGISVPKPGEDLSGDKWCIASTSEGVYCMLVDGLGHGFEANEAANLARRRFTENLHLPPAECLKIIHLSLRGSRGGVGAVAKIDFNSGKLSYCGLGNIAGVYISSEKKKHMTSLNGTLGYEARKFMEVSMPWNESCTLMMHSDGIASAADSALESMENSPALMAAWIYQNYGKKSDDATVLIFKGAHAQ